MTHVRIVHIGLHEGAGSNQQKAGFTATVTLSGASSSHNYKKMVSKEPVVVLMIPNSLFSLWKQRREIEESLLRQKTKLTMMVNAIIP